MSKKPPDKIHGPHIGELRIPPTLEQIEPLLFAMETEEMPRFEIRKRMPNGHHGRTVLAVATLPQVLWALELAERGRTCAVGEEMSYLCRRVDDDRPAPVPAGAPLSDPRAGADPVEVDPPGAGALPPVLGER